MLIVCLVISIFTGLVSAGLAYAAGTGIVLALAVYSLTGASALVLSLTITKIVYPDWRAFD